MSTIRQGHSGLGLDAQRATVAEHVTRSSARLVGEFTEIESGKKSDRPQLAAALAQCRAAGATLLIAKLDRLARSVRFLATLMEGDVPFVALDLPGADRFTLHILGAVAEAEARAISERTIAALRAAKARGQRLGTPANCAAFAIWARSTEARQARAAARHAQALPHVKAWMAANWSIAEMANALSDDLRVPLPRPARGGRWTPRQVYSLIAQVRRPTASSGRRRAAAGGVDSAERESPARTRPRVFSVGYTGVAIADLVAFVDEHAGMRLVDIRHRPFSRNAAFNRTALAARLGDRYVHVPTLGNRNYRGDGPIALVDQEAGLATLRELLTTGPIALLCVCADARTCHRSVVAAALKAEGFAIAPWPAQRPATASRRGGSLPFDAGPRGA